MTLLPSKTLAPITANAEILHDSGTVALASTTALGAMPNKCAAGGFKNADNLAK